MKRLLVLLLIANIAYYRCYAHQHSQPNKKIMVFSPHPDDDLLGCGGSIAKHIKNGNEVIIVYMTSGEQGASMHTEQELAQTREAEATEGAKVLGVDNIHFLRNPDGYLTCDKKIVAQVAKIIFEIKPNIIYLPHKLDGHPDHTKTYELVVAAMPHVKKTSWALEKILGYEVWTPIQHVTHAENISDFMALKMEALQKHQSQLKIHKLDEAIKGLNLYRGLTNKYRYRAKNNNAHNEKYVECFEIIYARKESSIKRKKQVDQGIRTGLLKEESPS